MTTKERQEYIEDSIQLYRDMWGKRAFSRQIQAIWFAGQPIGLQGGAEKIIDIRALERLQAVFTSPPLETLTTAQPGRKAG